MFYGWIIVGVTFLIYFFNVGLMLYGAPAINAKMIKDLDPLFNPAVVGTAVAISTACQGVLSAATGALARKTGIKKLFIFGSFMLCAGSLAIAFGPENRIYFIAMYGSMMGIGLAFGGMLSSQTLLNDWFNKKKGFAMSIAVSSGSVCGMIAPTVISKIVEGSWKNGWLLIAAMTAVSALLTAIVVVNRPADKGQYPDGAKEAPPVREKAEVSVADVFKRRNIYLVMTSTLTRLVVYYGVMGHLIIFLTRDNGMERTKAAVALSIISTTSLLSRIVGGTISGQWMSAKLISFLTNIFNTVGLIVLITSQSLPMVYAAALILGVGFGAGNIAHPLIIAEAFGTERFPVITGATYPVNYIIGALGPLMAGVIATALGSYIPFFIIAAIVCALGGFGLFLMKSETETQAAGVPAEAAAK